MRRAAALLLALLPLSGGCRPAAPTAPTDPVRVDVPAPALAGSRAPQLATGDGRLLLSWVEPADSASSSRVALRFATWEDAGWSTPRTAAGGADWVVSGADMPGVVPLPGGALGAHWLVRGPGAGYTLRVSRSHDGGRTWTPPVTPHRDGTATEHGFAHVIPWGDGQAGLFWLDGRKYAAPAASAQTAGGETALRFATLAPDGTPGDESELDARTCDCCQTAAALTSEGPLIAYRGRSTEEVRDIFVVRAQAGTWKPPYAVHPDNWRIDGCPVNGPAVAADGRAVAVAWFTMADDDRPHVRLAFSSDAGATFGTPLEVADGAPLGHVGVVLDGPNAAYVSYLEGPAAAATLRLRHLRRDGPRGAPVAVAESLSVRATGFPALARTPGALVMAWTSPARPGASPALRTAHWSLTPTP